MIAKNFTQTQPGDRSKDFSINNNCFLLTILILKLVLLVIFTSGYSKDLFQPFVRTFIDLNVNPWQYYFDQGLNIEAFPYHPLMLYILTIFSYPIIFLGIKATWLINILFKAPLFLSDLAISYILLKLFPDKKGKIALFYFLSPIIIYSTYIHSQLDIIPTALIMIALYSLIQNRITTSAIFIGLALATKTHVILALPLVMIYLFKTSSIKRTLLYPVISAITFLIFEFPFLSSEGFREMVLFNSKQSLLFDSFYKIGNLKVYLPLFVIILVLTHFFNQRKINTDLLFFYFGILFTSVIFLVVPAPAWFVWIVPFISIFFINDKNTIKSLYLFILLNIFYLLFFVFFHKSNYIDIIYFNRIIDFKINNICLLNISYTFLEAIIIANLFTFYKYGVKSNSIYKKNINTVIGIGGASGAGKTLLLNDIALLLGNKLLKLEGDGEHKWERGDKQWNNITHLNPKANYIHNQAKAISDLKNNKSIYRSEYNHDTGKLTCPSLVKPKEYITISGLHPFYLPIMRKNIDLKIYVDTDNQLREHWKTLRDNINRNHPIEKVLKQMENRAHDNIKHIYPQKRFADIVIKYYPLNDSDVPEITTNIPIGLKIILNANTPIENILEFIDCELQWDYNEDLETQFIDLKTEPEVDYISLSKQYIQNINELIDSNFIWLGGYRGFVQFIILLSLSEKMKGKNE